MTVQNVKAEVKTIGGQTITADDAVVKGAGTAVYTAIENFRMVKFDDGNGTIQIAPFHAIDFATITVSTQTITDPVDDVCP